jgi:hypothetical protein
VKASAEELRQLARKYRALADLWRAGYSDASDEALAAFRPIASEFPGALREYQMVPQGELDRRAEALERAAEGGPRQPWMDWMHGYHALMRAALAIKRRLARARIPSEARARAIAEEVSAAGAPVDAAFVRAVARPPDGRINVVVFARLGALTGVAPDEIWEALFPAVRPGRY